MDWTVTIPYDTSQEPPAPILSVKIAGVVQSRPRIQLSALIDTGADITAIPKTVKTRYQLDPIGRLKLEGIGRLESIVYTYDIVISIPDLPSQRLEVILSEYPFVILGRDWLKAYRLMLDGPQQHLQLG